MALPLVLFQICHLNFAACLQVVEDLAGPAPMHRLLQGDVGSGKTAVAFLAMLAAAGSGCQAALMAPTEVRCRQAAALYCFQIQEQKRSGAVRHNMQSPCTP